jgi:glycosyltransferase involved in cell wall biosynthesis
MLHVHVMCEPYGGTLQTATYVRTLLPLCHPANASAVSVTYGMEYRPADVVLVERRWLPDYGAARRLVARARLDDVPVIYVTDDNLLELDAGANHGGYITPEHRTVIEYLAREAEGVIVSTAELKKRMSAFHRRIAVVPNALDERLVAGRGARRPAAGDQVVIGYMGTATHDADLLLIIDALRSVLRDGGGAVEFQLVGGVRDAATLAPLRGLPVRVLKAGDGMAYPAFMRWFAAAADWDLAVAPLKDTLFTRCKSDLKFVDYGALGIPTVFSNVTPYADTVRHLRTGYLAENTVAAWRGALAAMIGDRELRESIGRNARDYVLSKRTLSRCARRWVTAIRAIARPDPPPAMSPSAARTGGAGPAARKEARGAVDVIVPGSVNYFYNLAGERIADALRSLGYTAAVHTLRSVREPRGGCTLLVNPAELLASCPRGDGLRRLADLTRTRPRVAAVTMECAGTHWFTGIASTCEAAKIRRLIDVGFVNQHQDVPAEMRRHYHFVVNGLTATERGLVRTGGGPRAIPWVIVGHHSPQRAALAEKLVRLLSPGGIVYLPSLAPVTETGPHMNDHQFRLVLERSNYQIWCSHHDHFYMESERFRMSLLTGGIPIKVLPRAPDPDQVLPFQYLMPGAEEVADVLGGMDVRAVRARFEAEFLALPALEDGLAEVLTEMGYPPPTLPRRRAPSVNGVGTRGRD